MHTLILRYLTLQQLFEGSSLSRCRPYLMKHGIDPIRHEILWITGVVHTLDYCSRYVSHSQEELTLAYLSIWQELTTFQVDSVTWNHLDSVQLLSVYVTNALNYTQWHGPCQYHEVFSYYIGIQYLGLCSFIVTDLRQCNSKPLNNAHLKLTTTPPSCTQDRPCGRQSHLVHAVLPS